jgi:hypothetical protein
MAEFENLRISVLVARRASRQGPDEASKSTFDLSAPLAAAFGLQVSDLAIGLSLLPSHTRPIPNRSACLDNGPSPSLFPYGLQKQSESFLNLEKFPEILGLLESCVRAVRSRSGLSASLATESNLPPGRPQPSQVDQ